MIKEQIEIVRIPETEKKITTYVTSDNNTFRHKWNAECHERLIQARKVEKTLATHSGWVLVRSHRELESVWLCASNGKWWDSQHRYHISFPSWVCVSVYQDEDRYWHTEIDSLNDGDFRNMAMLLVNALHVITKTPHILAYLRKNDPQALEQCLEALGDSAFACTEEQLQ